MTTDLDLDAIRARIATCEDEVTIPTSWTWHYLMDVPTLLAEVERLRALITDLGGEW